jgi:hypothetical protein
MLESSGNADAEYPQGSLQHPETMWARLPVSHAPPLKWYAFRRVKPAKREVVNLVELRSGDICVIRLEAEASLMVKVVDIRPTENALSYVPVFFSTVGLPEFVSAGENVCTSTFAPEAQFERIVLEAGA